MVSSPPAWSRLLLSRAPQCLMINMNPSRLHYCTESGRSLGDPLVTAQDPRYQVYQLPSVSAQAGNSVMLPCNFTYPQDIKPVGDLRVYWRRGGFFGKFIYNHTEGFIHQDYQGRIVLVGDPQGSHTALIRINQLRSSDANVYVCHVRVQKKDGQWEQWRNIIGTNLTVPGQRGRTAGREGERLLRTDLLPGGCQGVIVKHSSLVRHDQSRDSKPPLCSYMLGSLEPEEEEH
uniref:Ig-like domain-containing protein n=1 Tax=Pelusios castaneus TaxID=367368 RepID=A0A8C8S5K2_9SAUR